MRKNFKSSLAKVLKSEGGFSDHPKDPGGATNKGITLRTYNYFTSGDKSKADLRNITDQEIQNIYLTGYWTKVHCDFLPSGVDYALFDAAVNSGPIRAARWLQIAVDTKVDGIIGLKTLSCVNDYTPGEIIDCMSDIRLRFLRGLRTWETFGNGWGKRVEKVRAIALSMI